MHDIKTIRDNPQAFDAGLKRRGLAPLSASLLAIDERRRAAILASEQAQARRNAASKEIGDAKKAKDDARGAVDGRSGRLKTTMPDRGRGENRGRRAQQELAAVQSARRRRADGRRRTRQCSASRVWQDPRIRFCAKAA
jgi:seryl-tRNA synthetase